LSARAVAGGGELRSLGGVVDVAVKRGTTAFEEVPDGFDYCVL